MAKDVRGLLDDPSIRGTKALWDNHGAGRSGKFLREQSFQNALQSATIAFFMGWKLPFLGLSWRGGVHGVQKI